MNICTQGTELLSREKEGKWEGEEIKIENEIDRFEELKLINGENQNMLDILDWSSNKTHMDENKKTIFPLLKKQHHLLPQGSAVNKNVFLLNLPC